MTDDDREELPKVPDTMVARTVVGMVAITCVFTLHVDAGDEVNSRLSARCSVAGRRYASMEQNVPFASVLCSVPA